LTRPLKLLTTQMQPHSPPCRFRGGRRQSKYLPWRRITAASTRTTGSSAGSLMSLHLDLELRLAVFAHVQRLAAAGGGPGVFRQAQHLPRRAYLAERLAA
jgi:hypothetical protein